MTEHLDEEDELSVKHLFSGKSSVMMPAIKGTSGNVIPMHQPSFSGKLRKPRNNDVRSREHLTPSEVASLIKAAKETGRTWRASDGHTVRNQN